jgi:hypothetical protein
MADLLIHSMCEFSGIILRALWSPITRRLIQSLETNRLRNYLRVIEMQDKAAAAATSAG